jgi:uncharacterized protein with FMN-binding domain
MVRAYTFLMGAQTTVWRSIVGVYQQSRRDHSRADRATQRRMGAMWRWRMLLLGTLGLWLGGCSSGWLPHTVTHTMTLPAPDGWHDGMYTGTSDLGGELPTPQLVRVTVDVFQGRIITVRVHQPPGWHAPEGEELILRRALEQPSTALETPSPAGSAADQLVRALEDARSRARAYSPTSP